MAGYHPAGVWRPGLDRAVNELPVGHILAEDHHVHSRFSDDAVSTIAENLAAARARGLRTLVLTDHVRADSTWLGEYAAQVRAVAAGAGVRVLCGVEAKLLDADGRLDLPADLPELDRVLIADHRYPGAGGPLPPSAVRTALEQGELTVEEVADTIVTATARALRRVPAGGQLAHLFGLLPKIGVSEDQIGPDRVRFLAATARATGAVVEANEKWNCPGPAVLAEFHAAAVRIVAGSDSHRAADVGSYPRVARLLRAAGHR